MKILNPGPITKGKINKEEMPSKVTQEELKDAKEYLLKKKRRSKEEAAEAREKELRDKLNLQAELKQMLYDLYMKNEITSKFSSEMRAEIDKGKMTKDKLKKLIKEHKKSFGKHIEEERGLCPSLEPTPKRGWLNKFGKPKKVNQETYIIDELSPEQMKEEIANHRETKKRLEEQGIIKTTDEKKKRRTKEEATEAREKELRDQLNLQAELKQMLYDLYMKHEITSKFSSDMRAEIDKGKMTEDKLKKLINEHKKSFEKSTEDKDGASNHHNQKLKKQSRGCSPSPELIKIKTKKPKSPEREKSPEQKHLSIVNTSKTLKDALEQPTKQLDIMTAILKAKLDTRNKAMLDTYLKLRKDLTAKERRLSNFLLKIK